MQLFEDKRIIPGKGVGAVNGHTEITDVVKIHFNNEAAIQREIKKFVEMHAFDDIEHALVFSPDGNMYRLRGTSDFVNIGLLEPGVLHESRVIHNHPVSHQDSFSRYDFMSFFSLNIRQIEVIFGYHHNIMRYDGVQITPEEAYIRYKNAQLGAWQNTLDTSTKIKLEQLAIMRQLSKTMKGLSFYENPGF